MLLTPNAIWLLAAILAQGLLALILLFRMGSIRIPMILGGEVKLHQMAVSREPWPDREKQVSNAFDNQFQLPVLFYVAGLVAIGFGATLFEVVVAILFVASRYVHAYIHAIGNNVIRRFWAYFTGFVLLCVLWLDLAIRLVLVASGAN